MTIDGINISPEYVRGLLQRIKDLEKALELENNLKSYREFIERKRDELDKPRTPNIPWTLPFV